MENPWVRRLQKRAAAVDRIRQTTEYISAQVRPATPDPTDLSMSKRTWERSIQRWRAELRSASVEGQTFIGPKGNIHLSRMNGDLHGHTVFETSKTSE